MDIQTHLYQDKLLQEHVHHQRLVAVVHQHLLVVVLQDLLVEDRQHLLVVVLQLLGVVVVLQFLGEEHQVEVPQDLQLPISHNISHLFHKVKLLNASNGLNCPKPK